MSDRVGVTELEPLIVVAAPAALKDLLEKARPRVEPGEHEIDARLRFVGQLKIAADYEAVNAARLSAEIALGHFLALVTTSRKDLTAKLRMLEQAIEVAMRGIEPGEQTTKEVEAAKERVKQRIQKTLGTSMRRGAVRWSGIVTV